MSLLQAKTASSEAEQDEICGPSELCFIGDDGIIVPLESMVKPPKPAPEYLKRDEPRTKIPITIHGNKLWSLLQLNSHIYNSLKVLKKLPSVDVASLYIYCLFEKDFLIIENDIQIGGIIKLKKGDKCGLKDIFKLELLPELENIPPVEPTYQLKYEYGLALFLLFSIRLSKITLDYLGNYGFKLLMSCKNLCSKQPFHIPLHEIQEFPSSVYQFSELRSSKTLKKIAAILDLFFILNPGSKIAKTRFATLTTRNEDHACLNLMSRICLIHGDLFPFLQYVVLSKGSEDADRIISGDCGLDDLGSLTPYSRSLDLVSKSPYSSLQNPYLFTTMSVYLGCMTNASFFRCKRPEALIEPYITLGYLIYQFHKKDSKNDVTASVADEFTDLHLVQEEFPTTQIASGITYKKGTVNEKSVLELIDMLKSQRNKLLPHQLKHLKSFVRNNPRKNSLGDYILTMLAYDPNLNVF